MPATTLSDDDLVFLAALPRWLQFDSRAGTDVAQRLRVTRLQRAQFVTVRVISRTPGAVGRSAIVLLTERGRSLLAGHPLSPTGGG